MPPRKEPKKDEGAKKNGKQPAAEQAEPVMTEGSSENQYDTVNEGLRNVFINDQKYQPSPGVLDAFTSFRPIPEEAWMKAGLSKRELAIKRRIQADYNYILYGVTDVQGDQFISLAGNAGLDDRAMRRAEHVATKMPSSTGFDRVAERYGPQRQERERG